MKTKVRRGNNLSVGAKRQFQIYPGKSRRDLTATVSFQTCKRTSRHVEADGSERAAEVPAFLSLYPDVSLVTNFGCK